jgi:hypothetical protein
VHPFKKCFIPRIQRCTVREEQSNIVCAATIFIPCVIRQVKKLKKIATLTWPYGWILTLIFIFIWHPFTNRRSYWVSKHLNILYKITYAIRVEQLLCTTKKFLLKDRGLLHPILYMSSSHMHRACEADVDKVSPSSRTFPNDVWGISTYTVFGYQ